MKKRVKWLLFYGMISGLTAFNLPACTGPGVVSQNYTQQYQTVSALLAQATQTVPDATLAPSTPAHLALSAIPSSTPPAGPTLTSDLTASSTPPAMINLAMTPTVVCDLAQPGHPVDVTVPDDTPFHPGEAFSKTWRLVNAGSCPWNQDYQVIWFSGDDLGLAHSLPLPQPVEPGESVEITADMLAPQEPGAYQSNWKLSNRQGELFGIGPDGNAPFWVRIVVVSAGTATALPTEATPLLTVTPTETPEALSRNRMPPSLVQLPVSPSSPGGSAVYRADGSPPVRGAVARVITIAGCPGVFTGGLP